MSKFIELTEDSNKKVLVNADNICLIRNFEGMRIHSEVLFLDMGKKANFMETPLEILNLIKKA